MNNGLKTPQAYAPAPFPAPPHAGYGQPPGKSSNRWIIVVVLLVIGLPVMLVVLGALGFFLLAFSSQPSPPPEPAPQAVETSYAGANEVFAFEQWRCTNVIDGNTIEVAHMSDKTWVERVRLLCITTPRKDQPGHDEAKLALEVLVLGRQVATELDPMHRKRLQDGTLLAYVILEVPQEVGAPDSGGYTNVNIEMVKQGHSKYVTANGGSSMYAKEFTAAGQ